MEKRGGGGGAAGGQGETAGSKSSLLHIRSAVRVPHRDVLLGFVESEVACLTPEVGLTTIMGSKPCNITMLQNETGYIVSCPM